MYLETEKYGKATPIVDEFLGKWSPNLLASFVAFFLNVSRPLRLFMGAPNAISSSSIEYFTLIETKISKLTRFM